MQEFIAPEPFETESSQPRVFLAGSIEMGLAIHWQTQVTQALKEDPLIILNPRRANWDKNRPPTPDFEPFKTQVEWELAAQEAADLIVFYFDPQTRAPITLLELGLALGRNKKAVVCCPTGFWRKGNIDLVCQRYGVPQVADLDELIAFIRRHLLKCD